MARLSAQLSQADQLLEYTRQLARHTKGRTALLIQLSALEKPFRESFYRQKVAQHLRKLADHYDDARVFAMPNADTIILLKAAKQDDIEPTLIQIRRDFAESAIVKNLDPVQGVSDAFVGWYYLEKDYQFFLDLAKSFAEGGEGLNMPPRPPAAPGKTSKQASSGQTVPVAGSSSTAPTQLKARKGVRTVKISQPASGAASVQKKPLDATRLRQLVDGLKNADVSNFIRRQQVMAVIKTNQVPVFTNRFIPLDVVGDSMMPGVDLGTNLWLRGYLMEFLSARLLASGHDLGDANSIATSVHLAAASILDAGFDAFDAKLGSVSRAQYVIEISLSDMLENPVDFKAAREKLTARGFKICLSDIEPLAFLKLNATVLNTDFIKIRIRNNLALGKFDSFERRTLIDLIAKIGRQRVILDGVHDDKSLKEGISFGFSLFQGQAISPVST